MTSTTESSDDENQLSLAPKQILYNRFELINYLGSGSFSSVWNSKDLKNNKNVVVKISRNSGIKYFDIEAKILQACNDKQAYLFNIVHYWGKFDIPHAKCLVFERLSCTLLDLTDHKSMFHKNKYIGLLFSNFKIIAHHILVGLEYLHNTCQLVHTDLKPENIMFCTLNLNVLNPGRQECSSQQLALKIIDLGNACHANRCSNAIQTRDYRCPETILQLPCGVYSDMWSLGCILYEILTSWLLFHPRFEPKDVDHLQQMQTVLYLIPQDLLLGSRFPVLEPPIKNKSLYKLLKASGLSSKHRTQTALFIAEFLVYDPKLRISATQALQHSFFK